MLPRRLRHVRPGRAPLGRTPGRAGDRAGPGARRLVEMHGGTIAAHSEGPGTGSEFVVRLPVLAGLGEPSGPAGPDRAGAPRRRLPRRRILVVDDNVDAAESLARLLTRLYGHEVRVAHDGPEALAAAEEFRPEVVLLDIGLPGMDGYEVARRLRERPEFEETLLVALTGWGQEADRRRSRRRASTTTWSSRRARRPSSNCSRRPGRANNELGVATPDDPGRHPGGPPPRHAAALDAGRPPGGPRDPGALRRRPDQQLPPALRPPDPGARRGAAAPGDARVQGARRHPQAAGDRPAHPAAGIHPAPADDPGLRRRDARGQAGGLRVPHHRRHPVPGRRGGGPHLHRHQGGGDWPWPRAAATT